MQRRLGISVYPEKADREEIKEYISLAANYGFNKLFTCLLSAENSKEEVIEIFSDINSHAQSLNYEVVLDVSPQVFEKYEISYDDLTFFDQLKANTIRLDLAFDGSNEALLTYNQFDINIELNLSNDIDYLNNIMTYKPNTYRLTGCHNFYPQNYTGLKYDFFVDCTKRFKKYNLNTAAFITSQSATLGPWDICDGLCTLETHRTKDVVEQAKELWATNLIDDIIIGNMYASESELKSLSEINRYTLSLKLDLENDADAVKDILDHRIHVNRGDINDYFIRSTEVRKIYNYLDIKPNGKHDFEVGDVVVGNNNFGKYKAELQIITEACSDERKNKIGTVTNKKLIDYIEPWTKFRLEY